MHVDGFRFDLAPVLARELYEVNRLGTFFDIIQQDPVISQVKLIAEPWDVGPGRLPGRELPGRMGRVERQVPRRRAAVLAGRPRPGPGDGLAADRAPPTSTRGPGGGPTPRVNFVTAHDGYTLNDLVDYEQKHNEANGEDNRDGDDNNNSRNWGAEGPTESSYVRRMRERMKRNFLATLLFSAGRPDDLDGRRAGPDAAGQQQRLLPGQRHQLGRTGSCRRRDRRLLEFTRHVLAVFRSNPVLRRRSFFTGRPMRTDGAKDVVVDPSRRRGVHRRGLGRPRQPRSSAC